MRLPAGRPVSAWRMEKIADTWVTAPKRVERPLREACLVHIYPTGPNMGHRYPLNGKVVNLGRAEESEIQVPEFSVSRRHARLELGHDGYYVADLKSTNGTFVNDQSITHSRLHDGDYLRVGNCIFRFLSGGNLESEYHEEIYRLTIIDALTGIHNQRYMMEFLDRELARSARHQRPLTFVMVDIDNFKKVNDEHGHLGGDFVLRELANTIKMIIRREDLFARYGGEEFSLVLVETQLPQGLQIAERIREVIEAQQIQFDGKTMRVTVSVGLTFTCGDASMSVNQIIRQADEQLYKAKADGRNRVCC
jgi:diguanylate cyclase (GGDEF)-like protein